MENPLDDGLRAQGCCFYLADRIMPHARLFHSCLLLLAAAPHVQGQQEAPAELRPRWEAGARYLQETLTETVTDLSALGSKPEQGMKVKQTTRIEVRPGEEGGKLARVTFTAMSGEAILDGKRQTFDSSDLVSASPEIRASVGRSLGQSFVLVYDKEDRFVEVRDSSSMLPPTEDGQPKLEGIAEAAEVAELFRRSLEMGLPKTAVRSGDHWTTQEEVRFPSAGAVKVELRARYEAQVDYLGRPHAKISFNGVMKPSEESAGARPVTLGEGSKLFGQVLFDLGAAMTSFGAFRADLTLDVRGKKVPVRQQVTTRMTREG